MSTSVVSHGKVQIHRERGELPHGWEVDGVLQALGGYKGFGLALAVEILAGVLTGRDTRVQPGPRATTRRA